MELESTADEYPKLPTTLTSFSGKADNYVRYRPGYPDALIDYLAAHCGLTRDSTVADLGSGTGTLTRMLLDHGSHVLAVEPNPDMRAAAERLLSCYPRFSSIEGTAEATTLETRSVDLVTAGRALQWFDIEMATKEIARILKPGGFAVFVWIRRKRPHTPAIRSYEKFLLDYCDGFSGQTNRRNHARTYLEAAGFKQTGFDFEHKVDLEQLKGLVHSYSICPAPGSIKYKPMLTALEEMFNDHRVDGYFRFHYTCVVYYGRPFV